jgi:hypothetical protein
MADETQKKIDAIYDRMIRSSREQERASDKLSDAMKELGDKALASLIKNVKDAAKTTGILNDEQLETIHTSKDLIKTLAEQEERLNDLITIEKTRYKQEVDQIKQLAGFEKFSKAAQERLLEDANKTHDAEMKKLDDLLIAHDAFDKMTDAQAEAAKRLDVFSGFVQRSGKALGGWILKTFTAENAMNDLKDAVKQSVGELNKATAVGLQDSLFAINKGAMHLNLSFDEFSDVISKNRDLIRQLGSGTTGVKNFTDKLSDASKGLAYMGKDGVIATSKMIDTLKSIGITANSKGFTKSITGMQKHFSEFSALYGDSVDSFNDVIEVQMKSAGIQARLNNLDDVGRQKVQDEILARTENIKNLGLSNDQIKAFNQKLEDLYDPEKANVVEKVQSSEKTKAWLQMLAEQSGSEAMSAALPKLMEYAEATKGSTPQQLETMRSTMGPELKTIREAESMMTRRQESLAGAGEENEAMMVKQPTNIMRESAGGTAEDMEKFSGALVEATISHKNLTKAQIEQGKTIASNQLSGNVDDYVDGLKKARDVMQSYDAVMENSITKGLKGVAEGLGALLIKTTKLGTVFDALAKTGSLLSGGGAASASAGAAELAGGAAGGAALVKGAAGVAEGASFVSRAGAIVSKALPFARAASGLGMLFHSEELGGKPGTPDSDQWTPAELAKMTPPKTDNVLTTSSTTATGQMIDTSSKSVPIPPGAPPATPTSAITGNPALDEMKKQTNILAMIAQNTMVTFKPPFNPDTYKASIGQVHGNL